MQHIIWISPGFAANELDSQCIPPQQLLAQALSKNDQVQLHIVSLHYPYTDQPYQWHGITTHPCYAPRPLRRLRIWNKAFRKLRELLRQYPKAIVHSFWMNDACLIAQMALRGHSNRHLVTLMGQDARASNRYLPLIDKAKLHTVALSQFHAKQYYSTTGQEVDGIIPWGLARVELQAGDRPYHLIAIGNLIPLKQFEQYVKLVYELQSRIPGLRALLIGDGPERSRLEAQADALGIKDQLEFTGAIARERVMDLLAQAKVLVHPSSYESFGFVMVEALQQGTAVVAYPVGIAEELPGIVLARDFAELVDGTISALESAAVPQVPTAFTLEQVAHHYLQLYDDLAANKSK